MRTFARAITAMLFVATAALVAAGPATASTPADKPVVVPGRVSVEHGGGVTPDSWRTYLTVPVGGYNFTAGGSVYVTFQDLTAGTAALSGEWITAGTGPCGLECNNYGRTSYTRTISYPYRTICGHWFRVLAWDSTKSPQAGYGWSSRDLQISC